MANADLEDLRGQLGEKPAAPIALEVIPSLCNLCHSIKSPTFSGAAIELFAFTSDVPEVERTPLELANTYRSHLRRVKGWNCISLNLF